MDLRAPARVLVVSAVASAALGSVVPIARATGPVTRFASPTGSTLAADCTVQSSPCELAHAASQSLPGDDLVVLPGSYDYTSQQLSINAPGVTIHGLAGSPRPTISGKHGVNIPVAFYMLGGTLRHLAFVADAGAGIGYALDEDVETVEDVAVTGTGVTGGGVLLRGGVFRDSTVQISTSSDAAAIYAFGGTIRNVTAYATGVHTVGVQARNSGGSGASTLTAVNVIAHGDLDDISARNDNSTVGSSALTIDHSAYSTVQKLGPSTTVTATATIAGAPLLASPATGDFHQLAGSPTIDAGVADPANGATDADGYARVVASVTDVGAYEHVPPTVTTGPATTVTQTGATLTASVNPGSAPTTVAFRIDSGPGAPRTIAAPALPGDRTVHAVTLAITGLTAGTAYTYTVLAGAATGADVAFTTSKPAPPAPPVLSGLHLNHRAFVPVGMKRPKPDKRHRPSGAAFSYTLSAPGTVTVMITRTLPGKRNKHKACVAPTKALAHAAACKRAVAAGSLSAVSAVGPGTLAFTGRARGHALPVGTYVATVIVRDALGQTSVPRTVAFTIVAP